MTDAFAFILTRLLAYEPEVARDLICRMCFGPDDDRPDIGERITVTTQITTDDGRPDIRIDSERLLVLVECKKGSGLGETQMQRYRRALTTNANGRITRLVLLTVFPIGPDDGEEADRYLRWHQIADWMGSVENLSDVSCFIINQFLAFLGEQIMTVEQVAWQYLDGTRALCHLTDMLSKALELAQIRVHQGSSAWDYRGFYTERKEFWVGVYLGKPRYLQFEFSEAKPNVQQFTALGRGEVIDGKYAFRLDLASEAVHFFARTKESQLDYLTEFLRSAYQDGRACMAP